MQNERIRLFEGGAKHTQAVVDAMIDEAGDLVVYGRDLGAVPEEAGMLAGEEYEIRVRDRDRVLLALLKERFGEDPGVVEDIRQWLDERGIAYRTDE